MPCYAVFPGSGIFQNGNIHVYHRKKLEELWSPIIGAWFEGGPEDQNAVLLELDISEASMWASTSNPFRFGYQIAKANLTEGNQPDAGEHVVHTFHATAIESFDA